MLTLPLITLSARGFLMQWYLKVLRHYFDFTGRARRTEFWMFTLFNWLISFVLLIIDNLLFASGQGSILTDGPLGLMYSLAVLLPSLGVAVRRLHDTGRSGWWLLIALIPIIGWILVIVWYATDGQPEPNQWGANPKTTGPAVVY
jgi:uncharacterized membrane protein YhaH (DUF805 family)